jgi:inner membrane protein
MSDTFQALRGLFLSPGFKFFLICFLILLLLIPLGLVFALISERESRASGVRSEVASTWGRDQIVSGPFIIAPYTVSQTTVEAGKEVTRVKQRNGVFLPEDLTVTADTKSKVLHRSIFDVNVYTATTKINGRFAQPDIRAIESNAIDVRWQDAILALALSDPSGLKTAATVDINGVRSLNFEPSLGLSEARQKGIHTRLVPLNQLTGANSQPPDAFEFSIGLDFRGSTSLRFSSAARNTKVEVTADWPHPSFQGSFLPSEREVSDNGFAATWEIPHLARSIPQAWAIDRSGVSMLMSNVFGVTYYSPVDFYDRVSRAAKYGVLFLSLAFMAVFVMELLSGRRIHAVQYMFVGLAMIFFYVLLLSIAEHIGFASAYAIASLATGIMLALYFARVFDSMTHGLAAAALFIIIYGFLYMVLQMEDYALLAGAILGFVALTAVMFATLRVDWSSAASRVASSKAQP